MSKCRSYSKKVLLVLLSAITVLSSVYFCVFSVDAISRPGKISSIKITKTCSTAVTLYWSKSLGAQKYIVYKKRGSENYRKVTTTASRTCIISNLIANKKYTFKIKTYKVVGGKKYYGPSKTKTINLKSEKTKTPKLTYSNVKTKTKGIIKCLARSMWLQAYVQYHPEKGLKENDSYYWLVTDINSISAHKNRCQKYLTTSCYNKFIDDDLLIEKNNHLYIKSFATGNVTSYDVKSIFLSKKSKDYYYVRCNAYTGFSMDETKYVDEFKIKFTNGYFKCYSVKNISSKYVGTVTESRDLVY